MSSWRDEIPPDLPREQMLVEAVSRGTARRRRRQRREAALGGSLGLLVIVLVAVAAMSLSSPGASTNGSDATETGVAGADSSAGSTQQPESISPESGTGTAPTSVPEPPPTTVAPALAPLTTAAAAGQAAPTTTPAPPVGPPATTPTTAAAPPPTVGQAGAPEFAGASGNAGTQRVIMRFTRPVVAGASERAATFFVVHQAGDSTCSSPTGAASRYLDGLGTTTVTVDAPNLVVGTTYISIAQGFVRNAQDGTENAPVACTGILVKG